MRLSWFTGRQLLRSGGGRSHHRRSASATLRVRQLERRRVLDGAVQAVVVTAVASADSPVTTPAPTADTTSQTPTAYSWTPPPTTNAQPANSAELAQGAVANVPPVLVVPLDQNLNEGQLLDLSGTSGAPPLGLFIDTDLADTHTATVDWGDGSPMESTTIFQGVGVGTLGGTHVYADQGTFTVTVTVMDNNGGSDSDTFHAIVAPVAPTATLSNNGPVVEGSPSATVSFSNQFDPSSTDTAAGFHYAYDINNDCTFDVGDGTYGGSVTTTSANVPGSFLTEGPSDHTVTARIIDKDGQFTDYTTTIHVLNVAPTLTNITGDTINENDVATIGAKIVDPSATDVFEVQVNWLDGSTATIGGLGAVDTSGTVGSTSYQWTAATRSLQLSHQYLDDGLTNAPSDTYNVSLIVKDDDLDATGPYTAPVVVNDLPPVLVVPTAQNVFEGDTLDLSGMSGAPPLGLFIDTGTLDTHTATVNWGDGSGTQNAAIIQGMGAGALGGTHVYADDGMYMVTVTVTDKDGKSDSDSFVVNVANRDPVVQVPHGDQSIFEGDMVSFVNLATFTDAGFDNPLNPNPANPPQIVDPLHESFTYDINWGDGTGAITGMSVADVNGGPGTPSSGIIGGSHTYADNGDYTVTITVHDDNGGVGSASFTVTVANKNPVVTTPNGNQNILEGQTINFANLATFTDAGFDNPANPNAPVLPNIADPLHESFTYDINWGDGRDAFTGMSIADLNGGPGTPSSGTIAGIHTYADDGVYQVTVTVHDDNGGVGMSSFFVTVGNQNPIVATPHGNQSIFEGDTVNFSDLATFTDAGFDNPVNPNAAVPPNITDPLHESFTYDINWGDGTGAITGMSVSDINGGPGTPSSGSIAGSHTYADDGTYAVTVTVHDDNGGVGSASFTVTVANKNPVVAAPHGNQSIFEGDAVSFSDLATFTDAGFDNPANPNAPVLPNIADPLHESFTYDIDWGDGRDAVTGASIADLNGSPGTPSSGTIGGSHAYADDGVYQVTVTVHDDNGGVGMSSFFVTVGNQNPIVTAPNGDQSILEGQTVNFTNLATFTDAGFDNPNNTSPFTPPAVGDPLAESFTYDINWGDGRDAVTGASIADINGGPGVPSSGTIAGSHTYADDGDYTVMITVHDDNGGMGTAQFKVHVDNVEPTLTGTSNLVVNEGDTFTLNGLGVGVTDPGFDNPLNTLDPSNGGEVAETLFAMSINWGDGTATEPLSLAEFQAQPFMGPTTAMFPGASHTYADNGTYTVSVTIKDDNMASFVTRTFTIQVDNVVPTLTTAPNQPGVNQVLHESDNLVLLNLGSITDPGFNNPLNPLSPPNGSVEVFRYFVDWGDGTTTATGDATIDNIGSMGILTAASFDGSHVYADDGTYTVKVRVADDDMPAFTNGTAFESGTNGVDYVEQTFTVAVMNVNPSFIPVDATHAFSGTDVDIAGDTTIQVSFQDPGFDNLNNQNQPLPGQTYITDINHESFTRVIDWGDGTVDAVHDYAAARNGSDPIVITVTGPGVNQTLSVMNFGSNDTAVLRLVTKQDVTLAAGQLYTFQVDWGNGTIQEFQLTLKDPTFPTTEAETLGHPVNAPNTPKLASTTVLSTNRVNGNALTDTTGSFEITHNYTGPPDPLHASAPIPITVMIVDDNNGPVAASIAVKNPGIQSINVRIDTTPQVPKLIYAPKQALQVLLDQNTNTPQSLQTVDTRIASNELAATSDRYLELDVISPEGVVVARYRLRDEALADLRGLIATLPDNHYRIYLIRTDNNVHRLVLDVYVRGGHVVDPSDKSEGTRDRPPEGSQQNKVQPLENNPQLERMPDGQPAAMNQPLLPPEQVSAAIDRAAVSQPPVANADAPTSSRLRWAAALAGVGLLADRGSWARELEAAFDRADERAWQRLRRAGRRRRAK